MAEWCADKTIERIIEEHNTQKVKFIVFAVDRYEIEKVMMKMYKMGYTCTITPNTAGVDDMVSLTTSKH